MRYAQFRWLWLDGIAIVFLIIAHNSTEIILAGAAVVITVFLYDRRMTQRKKGKQQKLIEDAGALWQSSALAEPPHRLVGGLTTW